MKILPRHKLIPFLASFALVVQLLAPSSLAARMPEQINIADFLCAPSGEISNEAKSAAVAWSKIVHQQPADQSSAHVHCPLCVTAQIAVIEEPHFLQSRQIRSVTSQRPLVKIVVSRCPLGPPLGLRAPPQSYQA